MSLVLDASATLAWLFGDETTPEIRAVFDKVAEHGAHVPNLWHLEIANSLTMAARRGRIDLEFRQAALADLALLDIAIDVHTGARSWHDTIAFADRHRLTLYDAAYLELAGRLCLPLATLDTALRKAARDQRVPLLGG